MEALELSDEVLLTVIPIIAYWVFSGIYELLGRSNRHRLHPKAEEDKKNLVSKGTVLKGMLRQQAIQIAAVIVTQKVGKIPFCFINEKITKQVTHCSYVLIIFFSP